MAGQAGRPRRYVAPLVPAGSAPDDAASDVIGLTRRSVVERQATVGRELSEFERRFLLSFPR